MNSDQQLRGYLSKLGLSDDIISIYLALAERSPQTVSEVARSSGVERTRIYRLFDELKRSGLVEIEEDYARGLLHAAPLTNLELLLTDQEQKVTELRTALPSVVDALQSVNTTGQATSVKFYRGPEGVRQMLWNQTRASGANMSILKDTIQMQTDARFFERWTEKLNAHSESFRSIVSDDFVQSMHDWYGPVVQARLQPWESRYVSPEQFRISTNTLLYDDVVAYYGWNGTEAYGIELRSQAIADTQRQLFELLWQVGQKELPSPL